MRQLLLLIAIISLLLLLKLPDAPPFKKVSELNDFTGEVITTGFIVNGKLCDDACIKVAGVRRIGSTTVTGVLLKKHGERILLVKRIE